MPSRVLAAISRLDGSLDLGENAQLLCHVEALRFRKILGTELQNVDRPPAPRTVPPADQFAAVRELKRWLNNWELVTLTRQAEDSPSRLRENHIATAELDGLHVWDKRGLSGPSG